MINELKRCIYISLLNACHSLTKLSCIIINICNFILGLFCLKTKLNMEGNRHLNIFTNLSKRIIIINNDRF